MTKNQNNAQAVLAFLELLSQADTVTAGGPVLSGWDATEPTGSPDNELIRFSWEDNDHFFSVVLTEGGIANGQWKGNAFVCEDSEGDEVEICLFKQTSIAPNQSHGTARIDGAFETVNTLLDASGALDSLPLQRAIYMLRLEIARAGGETARAAAAEASLQELNPSIAGLDLKTHEGWLAAANALLADKPEGTALVDVECSGRLVLADSTLLALAIGPNGSTKIPVEWGIPVEAKEPALSQWDALTGAWEGHDPARARDVLLNPTFVQLTYEEVENN